MKKIITKIFIGSSLLFLLTFNVPAEILILAPHPDDEALMFSGIIYRALNQGEDINIVLMTNGDYLSIDYGYLRQNETIAAMVNVLGVSESDITFLGYPDGGLETIYYYYTSPDNAYSNHGQTETYGDRGLGGTDYHTYKFGEPGKYNKPNILMDLESILSEFLPEHIYTTSEFDTHWEHEITYLYLRDALLNLSDQYPDYQPAIHTTLIHGGDDVGYHLDMHVPFILGSLGDLQNLSPFGHPGQLAVKGVGEVGMRIVRSSFSRLSTTFLSPLPVTIPTDHIPFRGYCTATTLENRPSFFSCLNRKSVICFM